jgi:anti-sigma regulatory factor (Ser/Thr protein kinase)
MTGPRQDSMTVRVVFTGAHQEIARLGGAVEDFCGARGVAPLAVSKVLLALEELLTNVAKYGRRGRATIDVSVVLALQGGQLVVVYEDSGEAFDPLALAAPDLDLPLEERPIGGLGIHLLRGLFDDVSYAWLGGRNQVMLRLRDTGDDPKSG